jgi:hypothetical protein
MGMPIYFFRLCTTMGNPSMPHERLPVQAVPVGRYIAISFIIGIGIFILNIGLATLFLFLLGFQTPFNVITLVIGSVLCFVGMGLIAPSIISLGGALSAHARESAAKLGSYLSISGIDPKAFSTEINTIRSNRPSFLTSLKLFMVSMILLFLLIISILIPLEPLLRVPLLLIAGVLSPIAMISSVFSLIEELEIWLYIHRSQELSILSRIPRNRDLVREEREERKSLISLGIFLTIVTLGLYIIYFLSISIVNLNRHMEWHTELDELISTQS